jgi:HK97 family phage major capsid protein
MNIHSLTEARAAKLATVAPIMSKAAESLSDAERDALDSARVEVEKIDRDIRNAHFFQEAERRAHAEPVTGGASEPDLRSYSLGRAILGQLNGKLDGLEGELHQELSRGREARGLMVPAAILLSGETRAQTISVGTKGGFLLPTTITDPADRFRPALRTEALGATVLRNLVGDVELPMLTASGTAQWINAESQDVTTTDAAFAKARLSAKTVAGQYELTRGMRNNVLAAEGILTRDLGLILAAAIDAAAINGAASPVGILNTAGVTKVTTETMGSPAVTDLAGTAANLIFDLNAADVPASARGFLMSPKVAQAAMKAKDADLHTIPMAEQFHNERFEVSSNVPDNIGGGANKSALIYGEWAELIVAYWSGVDLLVNPYHSSVASRGGALIHAFIDVDVAVRRAAAFAYAEI